MNATKMIKISLFFFILQLHTVIIYLRDNSFLKYSILVNTYILQNNINN